MTPALFYGNVLFQGGLFGQSMQRQYTTTCFMPSYCNLVYIPHYQDCQDIHVIYPTGIAQLY